MWDQESRARLQRWLSQETLEKSLLEELNSMEEEELFDSFYKELEFGTGGLRGILGAGSNRLNSYTIGQATQGLANYLLRTKRAKKVAIGYDSRKNSRLFAEHAACVLAANGIQSYLYDSLMPVPALSFAVRHHGCAMGIMITASHNPREYNGYKVYNEEGCQVTLAQAQDLLEEIRQVDLFLQVKHMELAEACRGGQIFLLGEDTKKAYLDAVLREAMTTPPEIMESLSVVYSPLNGAGNQPVRSALAAVGVQNLHIVVEQELPDEKFPTCPYPNPEKEEALELGKELLRAVKADLLLATDPDCDRLGVVSAEKDGLRRFTGDQVGILLLDFVCRKRQQAGTVPKQPVVFRTLVSSGMADAVAEAYGAQVKVLLTGFKFIGEQIGILERQGRANDFIFGFEESCGYLSGAYVRDKDAVNGAVLICQLAAECKAAGKTLGQQLEELYETYGYYGSRLLDFTWPGAGGVPKIAGILANLRKNPMKEICGKKVTAVRDYLVDSGDLPASDILEYSMEDGCGFAIRPSGTEPKLKLYLFIKANSRQEQEALAQSYSAWLKNFIA